MMLRYLDGALTPEEEARIGRRLEADPTFADEIDRLGRLRATLASGRARSFNPFFADLVMRRLAERESAPSRFAEDLGWTFRRISLAALAALVTMTAYSLTHPSEASSQPAAISAFDLTSSMAGGPAEVYRGDTP